jgi:hypothetical protein
MFRDSESSRHYVPSSPHLSSAPRASGHDQSRNSGLCPRRAGGRCRDWMVNAKAVIRVHRRRLKLCWRLHDISIMKRLIPALLLTLSAALDAAEPNYCHDPETNATWEQIKRNHRGERDVEALIALREKLCRKVDAGTMTVREATEQFETERERVIRERQEYNRRREAGGVGVG